MKPFRGIECGGFSGSGWTSFRLGISLFNRGLSPSFDLDFRLFGFGVGFHGGRATTVNLSGEISFPWRVFFIGIAL